MTTQQLTTRPNIPANITSQLDYIILDGSASMLDKWWPSIEAMDEFLRVLRRDHVDTRVIQTTFSDGDFMDMVQRNGHINEIPLLCEDPVVGSVFCGTALYDIINITVRNAAKMMPKTAHLAYVTDGEEYDSKYTDLTQAKSLLNWARAQGWQVSFIGCDFNNRKMADLLGANPAEAIGVAKAHLSEAMKSLGEKRVKHGRTGAPMHWSEDEQRQFGGYLTHRT